MDNSHTSSGQMAQTKVHKKNEQGWTEGVSLRRAPIDGDAGSGSKVSDHLGPVSCVHAFKKVSTRIVHAQFPQNEEELGEI
eukprot:3723784-Rhodomonas_salina.1